MNEEQVQVHLSEEKTEQRSNITTLSLVFSDWILWQIEPIFCKTILTGENITSKYSTEWADSFWNCSILGQFSLWQLIKVRSKLKFLCIRSSLCALMIFWNNFKHDLTLAKRSQGWKSHVFSMHTYHVADNIIIHQHINEQMAFFVSFFTRRRWSTHKFTSILTWMFWVENESP